MRCLLYNCQDAENHRPRQVYWVFFLTNDVEWKGDEDKTRTKQQKNVGNNHIFSHNPWHSLALMVWHAYSLLYECVCVHMLAHADCWGACSQHTNTEAHGGISMQIEKRRGDRRAWQALGGKKKRLPQKQESSCGILPQKSPGLNTQWEWDVSWGRERVCVCLCVFVFDGVNEKGIDPTLTFTLAFLRIGNFIQ